MPRMKLLGNMILVSRPETIRNGIVQPFSNWWIVEDAGKVVWLRVADAVIIDRIAPSIPWGGQHYLVDAMYVPLLYRDKTLLPRQGCRLFRAGKALSGDKILINEQSNQSMTQGTINGETVIIDPVGIRALFAEKGAKCAVVEDSHVLLEGV